MAGVEIQLRKLHVAVKTVQPSNEFVVIAEQAANLDVQQARLPRLETPLLPILFVLMVGAVLYVQCII